MKTAYITPQTIVETAQAETMLAVSIIQTGGDADIHVGTGDAPDEADVKEYRFGENIFD